MKVLLVQPYCLPESLAGDDEFSMVEPLGLEYIAAGAKDVCEIRLLDLRIENSLNETLSEYQPDVVGITGFTLHVNVVKRVAREIKQFNPQIKIVIGGHHATAVPEDYFDVNPDYIISGEGVFIFRDLIETLQGKIALRDIKGAEIRTENLTTIIKQTDVIPLADYPIPDRSITKKYKEHYKIYMKNAAAIRASAGCKFRCKFCSLWDKYKGYHTRDPISIIEELKSLEEEVVQFNDDESFLEPDKMRRLAELIKESGIKKKYSMLARADTIIKNKELFVFWREIGLEYVLIGVESINDDALKKLNKGTSVSVNQEAIRFLKKMGITVVCTFIVDPNFEKADFKALRKFVRKMKISLWSGFTILTPLPGTQLYQEVEHTIIDKQFEHYDFLHCLTPPKMPLKEFYKEMYKLNHSASMLESLPYFFSFPFKNYSRIWEIFSKYEIAFKNEYIEPFK